MLLMPTDDLVIGPICHMSECIAEFIAKDMMDKGGDIDELIREVTSLLVVVDAAISTSRLDGDDDWEQMRRCWAFIGPTLFNRLESLKKTTGRGRSEFEKRKSYFVLATIQAYLTIRRQTLELNDIEVFKEVPSVLST